MGRISEFSDEFQKDIVKSIAIEGHTYEVVHGSNCDSLPDGKVFPSKKTIGRWIKKWLAIIIAEIEAEKLEEDAKRHKKDAKRHKKTQKKSIDLRDLKDSFILWIKTLNPDDFTTPRNGTIKRIKTQNRYAFTQGTLDLLTQYLKYENLKVVEK